MSRNQVATRSSLEWRIRRQLLLVLLLVMSGLLMLVHISVSHLTQNFVLSRLEHDAESLIAALERGGDGRWQLNETTLPQVYQRVHSGHYYVLASDTMTLRSRSLWDLETSTRTMPVGVSHSELKPGVGDQQWLIREQGFSKQGQGFSLWIAEDIADLQQEQRQFEAGLLLLLLLSLPLLLILQRRVLRSGFARLEPLRQSLARQQAGAEVEFPAEIPQEVVPLVETITQLLRRSGEQTSRSRMALGNLAHELKHPLQELQWLARQHPDPEQSAQLLRLYRQLHQRIDRELRRARIAGAPGPGRQFVPKDEVTHLVRLLQRIGRDDIDFKSELPPGAIPFDRDDMLELLGNLLDNAWRHACRRVQLHIQPDKDNIHLWSILVEDDGKGVDDADLLRLSERGVRLDEQANGSGLGLSICRAVAESYDGELVFAASELGGLQVKVSLRAT
ncbi:MAG: sensor histidine kinase [Marinobacterium sp.]